MATIKAEGAIERDLHTSTLAYINLARDSMDPESLVMPLLVSLAREREADGEKERAYISFKYIYFRDHLLHCFSVPEV